MAVAKRGLRAASCGQAAGRRAEHLPPHALGSQEPRATAQCGETAQKGGRARPQKAGGQASLGSAAACPSSARKRVGPSVDTIQYNTYAPSARSCHWILSRDTNIWMVTQVISHTHTREYAPPPILQLSWGRLASGRVGHTDHDHAGHGLPLTRAQTALRRGQWTHQPAGGRQRGAT